MILNNKKILWFLGISGLILGTTIGRYIYLNHAMDIEAEENITPKAIEEVTNGNPEYFDVPDYDMPLNEEDIKLGRSNDSLYLDY